MKFRVETLAKGEQWWCLDMETPFGTDAWLAFERKRRVYGDAVLIRLSCRGLVGNWRVVAEDRGTFMAEFEKEEKPMSTKQRGDVEKVGSTVMFGVHINSIGNRIDFTRDEFRRIWEAGCNEFGLSIDSPIREMLAEKDAEIARLREKYDAAVLSNHREIAEVARLRGWLEKIADQNVPVHPMSANRCTVRAEMAATALAGEKVPE